MIFYNLTQNVYIATKDEYTECFSNMTKLSKRLPEIPYYKLYGDLRKVNTTIINGYTITKTTLR